RAGATRSFVLLTISLGVLLLIAPGVQAASFSSVQSGDWSNAATWGGGGVPVAGDSATINSGDTVTVSSNQAVSSLVVNNNGTLSVSSFEFNRNGAQSLAGVGTWTGSSLRVGILNDANANASNTSLANAVTLSVGTVTVGPDCTLSVTFPLTINGANFNNSSGGTVSLSDTLTLNGGVTPGKTLTNQGTITGNGTLQTQGILAINNHSSFSAPLLVQSGTTAVRDNFDGTTIFDGAISVAAGATLDT